MEAGKEEGSIELGNYHEIDIARRVISDMWEELKQQRHGLVPESVSLEAAAEVSTLLDAYAERGTFPELTPEESKVVFSGLQRAVGLPKRFDKRIRVGAGDMLSSYYRSRYGLPIIRKPSPKLL